MSLLLAACASKPGTSLERPWTDMREKAVTVSVDKGCPATLGGAQTVNFTGNTPRNHPIAANPMPTAGLICEYGWLSSGVGAPTGLTHAVVLNQADARKLASAINEIPIVGFPSGAISCPADTNANDVIAFDYSSAASLDLWYHATGCEWLSNGAVTTTQFAGSRFDKFQTEFVSLAPTS
jgi:hypothetical protein